MNSGDNGTLPTELSNAINGTFEPAIDQLKANGNLTTGVGSYSNAIAQMSFASSIGGKNANDDFIAFFNPLVHCLAMSLLNWHASPRYRRSLRTLNKSSTPLSLFQRRTERYGRSVRRLRTIQNGIVQAEFQLRFGNELCKLGRCSKRL